MPNEIIGETLKGILPDISMEGIGTFAIILLIAFLFIALLGVGAYFLVRKLKYNKKIIIFRRIGGKTTPTVEDTGMFERIGTAGDYWCRVRKSKKIIPRPRTEMRKNEFWFFQRQDGEWINFGLGDIDKQMKEAGVEYDNEDMRLQRLGIEKNLAQRFQKVTFWQKYGGMIMSLIFILIITVCFVILFRNMGEAWNKAELMSKAVRDMAHQVEVMSQRVGGGMQPVSILPLLLKWR